MDEKHIAYTAKPLRSNVSRRYIPFMLLSIALCNLFYWQPLVHFRPHSCTKHKSSSNGTTYPGEKGLVWETCGEIHNRTLECSRIDVPMDQFNSTKSGEKTFNVPLIRLRGSKHAKNLIVNPGGPGGSGIYFVHREGQNLSTIVGLDYHIVSFDPRGVNGSKPQALCYPDDETRQERSDVRSARIFEDSIEVFAWSQTFAKACLENLGEHGKYINTPQTAADMNTILDALGQKDMIYWGFSYGTLLGQTYATLFPDRSHRVIIDGVVNSFEWYGSLVEKESLVDAERVLFGFFDECIKAKERCPLAKLGETAEELQAKVLGFIADLQEEYLPEFINTTHWGVIKPEDILITGLFPATYKPSSWWTVADRLAKLLQGNATDVFLSWAGKGPWASILTDDSNTVVHMNDAEAGKDYWPQDRKEFLEYTLPYYNSSIFAAASTEGLYKQQHWLLPKTHDYKQRKGISTSNPLLILSTTYDPVCPLASAKSAQSAFEGSQIVELQAYGHCSLAMPSKCMARYVREFLKNGTVPEEHSLCETDGKYFDKPAEATLRALDFQNSEDQALYEAQLQIAQDDDWPYVL